MTPFEWDLLNFDWRDEMITIDDLVNKSERILCITVCNTHRHFQVTYVKDLEIRTRSYKLILDWESCDYALNEIKDVDIKRNSDYTNNMKLIIDMCDYEFGKLLFQRIDDYMIDGIYFDIDNEELNNEISRIY